MNRRRLLASLLALPIVFLLPEASEAPAGDPRLIRLKITTYPLTTAMRTDILDGTLTDIRTNIRECTTQTWHERDHYG